MRWRPRVGEPVSSSCAPISEGATRVVVGCGGSATTDGGAGALRAIGSPDALVGIELVAACDVTTTFVEAAREFAPQKGATAEQVAALTARLSRLAEQYRADFSVEVTNLPGSGAAGGLAGGLAAFGAELVSGFDLVADIVGLDGHLADADLVMTGEGYLDRLSFAGKVVGGVTRRVASAPGGRCRSFASSATRHRTSVPSWTSMHCPSRS